MGSPAGGGLGGQGPPPVVLVVPVLEELVDVTDADALEELLDADPPVPVMVTVLSLSSQLAQPTKKAAPTNATNRIASRRPFFTGKLPTHTRSSEKRTERAPG